MAERPYDDSDVEILAVLIRGLPPPPQGGQVGSLGPSPEEFARTVLDALAAVGWRNMAGLVGFEVAHSDGTTTLHHPTDVTIVRLGGMTRFGGMPAVHVTRLSWWRRVLRRLRGESGEVTTRRLKRGGYSGGRPASEVGPPSRSPSGSTGGQHG